MSATELKWEHQRVSTPCHNVFRATSQFACRVCGTSDFEQKQGDCTNGKRTVTFTKLASANCYGTAPSSFTEDCGDVELGLGVVIMVSIGVLAVVLLLVAIIAIIFRKKQQLEHKYSKLKATNTDSGVHVEMQNVDTSVADNA